MGLPEPFVGDEAPIRLERAVQLAFPDGDVTMADVRRAIIEGRFTPYEIAGATYTSIRELREMDRGVVIPPPKEGMGFIYVAGFGPYVKIGYTGKDIDRRLNQLRTGAPEPLVLYAVAHGTRYDEGRLHERFGDLRLQGEWFRNEGIVAEWLAAGCHLKPQHPPWRCQECGSRTYVPDGDAIRCVVCRLVYESPSALTPDPRQRESA
jgi:hypothetical protein